LNGTVPKKNIKNVPIVNLKTSTPLITRKRYKKSWDKREVEEAAVWEVAHLESVNAINADMKHLKLKVYLVETINVRNVALHYAGQIKIINIKIEVNDDNKYTPHG
jgi:hypothetical protein